MGLITLIPLPDVPLTRSAEWALKQNLEILSEKDVRFLVPQNGNGVSQVRGIDLPSFEVDSRFLRSKRTYSNLLLDANFYRRLSGFEWLHIVQLDVLLVQDSVDFWIEREIDFIGAPLRRNYAAGDPTISGPGQNGGLSLRRIEPCLTVLTNRRTRRIRIRDAFAMERGFRRRIVRTVRDGLLFNSSTSWSQSRLNEDLYWSHLAPAVNSWFRVAGPAVAAQFAWDARAGVPLPEKAPHLLGVHAFMAAAPGALSEIQARYSA